MRDFEKNCVAAVVAYMGWLVILLRIYQYATWVEREIPASRIEREEVRRELMRRIQTNERSRDILRMGPNTFSRLVNILRTTELLRDTKYSCVEEQVVKFLHILSHNVRNHTISFFFRRSGETISRHFHQVLRAIITLEDRFLVQPDGNTTPLEILNSTGRFYPYFKDCIGALDGTHVRVKVPNEEVPRYRGRKGYPTMNVLAASTFDLKFTYVLPGWEGSASDSRVLEDALGREDSLRVPPGKFYLADVGYMLKSGFLTPYRSTRYHLKEYSCHPPQNAKELFNLRHSSLHNSIERAFGVLKKRFPIIASGTEAQYDVDTQSEIVLACCMLHNFLMGHDPDEELISEVDKEVLERELEREQPERRELRDVDGKEAERMRNSIAWQMWNDYVSRNN